MIYVGIGANLPSPRHGSPLATSAAAAAALDGPDIRVVRRSRWYRSAPVPRSDQPWFVNGVVELSTRLGPSALMERLHAIERAFGRVRDASNAARVLDLDLLAFGAEVRGEGGWPRLPHPRMHERAFVLRPLAEIAPDWRHPVLGRGVEALIAALPADQVAEPEEEAAAG